MKALEMYWFYIISALMSLDCILDISWEFYRNSAGVVRGSSGWGLLLGVDFVWFLLIFLMWVYRMKSTFKILFLIFYGFVSMVGVGMTLPFIGFIVARLSPFYGVYLFLILKLSYVAVIIFGLSTMVLSLLSARYLWKNNLNK